MHELAITQSVVDAVSEHAGEARVKAVYVDVGKLCGIVPDAMRFCFELVTEGTSLEGAQLVIDEPAGEGVCGACGTTVPLADLVLLCPCGSADVQVTAGKNMSVRAYEVV